MLLSNLLPLHADLPPLPPNPGQFDLAPWPQQIPVIIEMEQSGLARVEVDPAIYRHSGPDFSALRLVRLDQGASVEQPWVVRERPAPERPSTPSFRQETESFNQTPDGAIEIVVVLKPAPQVPLRLEVDTPLRDFEKGLIVSVPAADGSWQDLVADGVLFDHSRFLDFRRTSVDLPRTTANRFRIRIADASDVQRSRLREISRTVGDSSGVTITENERIEHRDFRIDGLRFVDRSAPAKPEREEKTSADLALLERGSEGEGKDWIEFEGANLPIDRLTFASEDRNFRRAVSLQVPGRDGTWQTIQRGQLHRYEVGDFRDAALTLTFPTTRVAKYRLLIENGPNPPIGFSGITGSGPRHELFFLAAPGETFFFLLGAEKASSPRFDDAAIRAALARKTPARTATLGALAPNPGYEKGAGPPEPGFLESKSALWIAIAGAVAVLIWVLYGALRKVEEETAG